MANPPHKTPPSSRPLAVNSLLSPPDKALESFSSSIDTCRSFTSLNAPQPKPPMASNPPTPPVYASPPISPYDRDAKAELDTRRDSGVRDPPLFASSDASATAHEGPLFPPGEAIQPATEDVITQHMASPAHANVKCMPTRDEYRLFAECAINLRSTVFEQYVKDPKGYARHMREFEQHYPCFNKGVSKNRKAVPSTSMFKSTIKNKHLAPAPSSASRRQNKVALPRVQQKPRAKPTKTTPKQSPLQSFGSVTPETPSPNPKKEKREDSDFNSVPDCSPPTSTLPDNNKALKTDWKGTALPMDNDPHVHLLHKAEVQCASSLRLTAAVYLTSKRRIFQARIHALKIKKEFRKTDAQQACKIDVNKASKLWEVFNKVGWFEPSYFQQYL